MRVHRHTHRLALSGFGIALLALHGCSPATSEAKTSEATADAVVEAESAPAGPDLNLVEGRSTERWQLIVNADWIQAYDFSLPTIRAHQPLGAFLSNKQHHEYRNPSKPKLIGVEDEGRTAFLELAVLWEPHHPILQTVEDRPDDMTQELHMVETWKWHEGEWYFVENERHSDFMKEHPGILEKGASSEGETSQAGSPKKG